MLRKTLFAAVAVASLAAAIPAAAQSYGGPGYGHPGYGAASHSVDERQEQLRWRIDRAERRGALTRSEAWRLREGLRDIRRIEMRYRHDGRLSRWEVADLHRRLDGLQAHLRHERRDDDRRYGYGYGW